MNYNLTITDKEQNFENIKYIERSLSTAVERINGKSECFKEQFRSWLIFQLDDSVLRFIRPSIEDKIADVVTVNYKYNYFKKNIRTTGLTDLEYKLLLTALISADIEEDKTYVRNKIKNNDDYSIDGMFNFTMRPLKDKWAEVVSFIPPAFSRTQLSEFVAYLVNEKRGKRVFVDGNGVYDKHFNRLSRTNLIEKNEAKWLSEIILSAAGEVELGCKLPEVDEYYLKQFFGDKIFFQKTYFG